jgi:hypothetical protein
MFTIHPDERFLTNIVFLRNNVKSIQIIPIKRKHPGIEGFPGMGLQGSGNMPEARFQEIQFVVKGIIQVENNGRTFIYPDIHAQEFHHHT